MEVVRTHFRIISVFSKETVLGIFDVHVLKNEIKPMLSHQVHIPTSKQMRLNYKTLKYKKPGKSFRILEWARTFWAGPQNSRNNNKNS